MRVNLIATAITIFFYTNPMILVGIFGGLPEPLRVPFGIFAGLALGALYVLSRITRIEKGEKDDAAAE